VRVAGPTFGDAGDEERRRVVTGAVDRFAYVGEQAVEVGDDLHVLSGHVLLAGEQPGIVVAFTDRRDEPVDEDSSRRARSSWSPASGRVTQRRIS
jgi:hypothetical protein